MKDIKHYTERIAPQHKKPKFIKWLSTNIEAVGASEKAMLSYDSEFDIDNATGIQLDMLGDIVGRRRLLNFQPSDGSNPVLDDDTYRVLLKAKISQNHWDGTIPGMYELWRNLFSEYKIFIKDNHDMTMSAYLESHSTPSLLIELIGNDYIVPRPQGVGIAVHLIATQQAKIHVGAYAATGMKLTVQPFTAREIGTAATLRTGVFTRTGQYVKINPLQEGVL